MVMTVNQSCTYPLPFTQPLSWLRAYRLLPLCFGPPLMSFPPSLPPSLRVEDGLRDSQRYSHGGRQPRGPPTLPPESVMHVETQFGAKTPQGNSPPCFFIKVQFFLQKQLCLAALQPCKMKMQGCIISDPMEEKRERARFDPPPLLYHTPCSPY